MNTERFTATEHAEYAGWLRHNGAGFVLVLDPRGALLHEAGCPHVEPREGSLGAPRLVSRSIGILREYAREAGIAVRSCRACR